MKICFLASGGGGNFKFFYLSQSLGLIRNIELYLISDRECDSLEFAKKNNIYNKKIEYSVDYNKDLLKELTFINPDVIVTNWHKIIDPEIVDLYTGKLINLHYSLLPAFDGLIGIAPIKEAYKRQCQFIGTTCHYVDEGVDTGNIIAQAIVKTNIPIEDAINDVFKKGCLILLNSILIVTKVNIINTLKNTKYDFSPSLQFDDKLFNSHFWGKLSNL